MMDRTALLKGQTAAAHTAAFIGHLCCATVRLRETVPAPKGSLLFFLFSQEKKKLQKNSLGHPVGGGSLV